MFVLDSLVVASRETGSQLMSCQHLRGGSAHATALHSTIAALRDRPTGSSRFKVKLPTRVYSDYKFFRIFYCVEQRLNPYFF